jgi:hypothetical protein
VAGTLSLRESIGSWIESGFELYSLELESGIESHYIWESNPDLYWNRIGLGSRIEEGWIG